jgi:hypothetical protein
MLNFNLGLRVDLRGGLIDYLAIDSNLPRPNQPLRLLARITEISFY